MRDYPLVPVTAHAELAVPRRFTPRDVLEHFLASHTSNTLDAYSRDFAAFAAWLQVPPERAAELLLSQGGPNANALALEWLAVMQTEGRAKSTRARRLATLKSFVKAARLFGAVDWIIEVRGPKPDRYRDTRGPDAATAHKLFAASGTTDLERARNEALLALCLGYGLRRKEVVEIVNQDYDRKTGRLLIHGKGEKDVVVQLPRETKERLDDWLDAWERRGKHFADGDAIFRSLSPRSFGAPMTLTGCYDVVRRIGERAGVELHPHALRHTFVTTVLDESNGNTRMGQRSARHGDANVTERYDDNRRDLGAEGAQLAATALIPKKPEKI
jgi:integrase/recombinase XerD